MRRGWSHSGKAGSPEGGALDAQAEQFAFAMTPRKSSPHRLDTTAGVVTHFAYADAHSGAVAKSLDNDAFGRVLSETGAGFQPFGFAGGFYDADTKLVRFGVRDYDPGMGRWTNKDPIGIAGGDTNVYAYGGNDPVDLVDPSGLAVWICTALAGDSFLRFFGIGHRWVRTDTMEAGLTGSMNDTYIADHSPAKCTRRKRNEVRERMMECQ
jgi:RHS repeat-associated protein